MRDKQQPGDSEGEERDATESFTTSPLTPLPIIRGPVDTYKPLLICMNGSQRGQRFKLTAQSTLIGRSRDNDIVLTESGTSRHHSTITYQNFRKPEARPICFIEDAKSRNGTEVNGLAISERTPLKERDRITIGRTVLGYFIRDEEELLQDESLYENATRDQLTGLDNRRQLLSHMRHYMGLAERNKGMLCLVMIDIDDFKTVNDTHGHQVGDHVLRHVANTLMACVRESDLVARWGGEEFAVCLPDSSLPSAQAFADRLRTMLLEKPFVTGDVAVPVTLSIGISRYQAGDTTSGLFERSDKSLYAAKRGGKNRALTEEDLLPPES